MAEQERGDECGPALWTSTDGIAWSWASSDDQVFVPCEEDDVSSCVARVEGIVELSSGGLWAYGFSALGSTTWSSRDGLAWELGRSSFTPFGEYRGGYRWLDQVFLGGEGLVASGTLMTGGPALGVTVEDFGDGEGVIVESVESDGSAAAGGIREGDIIVLLGGEQVVDFPTLTRLLNIYGIGDTVAIVVVRQDGEVKLDVALGGSEEWLSSMLMATSANGEQWTQLEPPLVSGGNVSFGWVTEWSGGLTAKADVCDQAHYCQQLSLTSTDGISWQTHRFRAAFGDVGLSRIYGFGSGRLGVGMASDNQTGEAHGAFVASPDGDTWTLYLADPDVFPDAPWVGINDIIEFEDVTVAVGAADGGPAVWWYSG
jgi:hypothetical protein